MNFVNIYNKISNKILLYLPFLIIAFGIYARVELYLESYPLWHDEIEDLTKLINDNKDDEYWFIYFDPWNQIKNSEYNTVSQEIIDKSVLQYKKYNNEYASTYYVNFSK